jgi:CheY-like chemotaxis protein
LKKILVVDDEKGIRDLLHYLLEPDGFNVKSVSNGLEAVEIVKKEHFDLIFMDIHMPIMRGPEAFKKIKEIKPEQMVVIFSSSSDPEYVFESNAKQLGAFECIYKPFDIEEITNIVQKIFKN